MLADAYWGWATVVLSLPPDAALFSRFSGQTKLAVDKGLRLMAAQLAAQSGAGSVANAMRALQEVEARLAKVPPSHHAVVSIE